MSRTYFSHLNYTLANEDSHLELAVLPPNVGHAIAVCGSGSRSLVLLANGVKNLILCDLSPYQLWLAELRLALIRQNSWSDYVEFLGYRDTASSPSRRQEIFAKLSLPANVHSYFGPLMDANGWGPLIYLGKWERTIQKISFAVRGLLGRYAQQLFECRSLEEQNHFLLQEFPRHRWHLLIKLLGNANLFNALLYRGHFPVKNTPGSFFDFYREQLNLLLRTQLARENFFLQLLFLGRIQNQEAYPAEASEEIFGRMKAGAMAATVAFSQGHILECVSQSSRPVEFVSLSDVPSYFSGDVERDFMQTMTPGLAEGCLVVVRSYQHIPWRPDLTDFRIVNGHYANAISSEKTQMYFVDIFERSPRQARS
jgi:S-adenosylmethionine-diacylglycerol 3-amino-3-carboxypropyl transferase